MTTQLHDEGEEFIIKQVFESDNYNLPASASVGLYHDGEVSGDTTNGDDLADSSGLSAITTEPSGSAYARQNVDLSSAGFSAQTDANTHWYASNDNTLTFDLSNDSNGTIDAWFITTSYDRDQDSNNEDVLNVTGNLSQSYDLSNVDQLDISSDGVGHNIN